MSELMGIWLVDLQFCDGSSATVTNWSKNVSASTTSRKEEKMKQVCFWSSPFVDGVVMALDCRDCEAINPNYNFVRFQKKWASTSSLPYQTEFRTFGNELQIYVYNKYPSPSVYQLRKSWGCIKPAADEGFMPRLFPADKREGEGFFVLMIYSRT